MPYVVFGCRCVLIVVFAVSAWSKVRDQASFTAFRVAARALLPGVRPAVADGAALVVVAGEVAVVGALVVPVSVPVGLLLAAGLLAAFTVAIAAAVRRGATTSCRCFGVSATPLGVRHLVRNAVLLVLAVLPLTVGAQPAGAVGGYLLAVAAALVVAVLVVSFDVVTDLFLDTPASADRRS